MTKSDSINVVAHAGRTPRAIVRFLLMMLVVLSGDLLLKWWAFEQVAGQPIDVRAVAAGLDTIPPHPGVTLIPKVLSLRLTLNRGAVFGLGAGGRWVFVGFTAIAVATIAVMFWRSPSNRWWFHIALSLILAGALGNLYDRLRFGAVRDMLNLFPDVPLPFGWTWPDGSGELYPWIFNIADAGLLCGLSMILLSMLARPRE